MFFNNTFTICQIYSSMKRIYVTVDTECHDINRQDRYIWGRTSNGEEYGLRKILELGKELNIPINFFVDIPEQKKYGKEFIKRIINLIHKYNQKAYVHLHPNYITGETEQTFFWKYTADEKRKILTETKELCKDLLTEEEQKVFRIGRYGADAEMYDVLVDVWGTDVLDLSYCYRSPKMCHLTESETQTKNAIKPFRKSFLFPNTRYIGLRIGHKERLLNLDASETSLGEFKDFINKNDVENITLTMHSWNFIRTYFFCKNYVWRDVRAVRKFQEMVVYAQSQGYTFSDLSESKKHLSISGRDQVVDLCVTPWQQIKSFYYNFGRFSRTARLSPKWFMIYLIFYTLLLFCAVLTFFMLRN